MNEPNNRLGILLEATWGFDSNDSSGSMVGTTLGDFLGGPPIIDDIPGGEVLLLSNPGFSG